MNAIETADSLRERQGRERILARLENRAWWKRFAFALAAIAITVAAATALAGLGPLPIR